MTRYRSPTGWIPGLILACRGVAAVALILAGCGVAAVVLSGVGTARALSSPAALRDYSLREEGATHWRLPRRLEEISGLAMTSDGRVLAHDDEVGVVFELDPGTGEVVKEFRLSDGDDPVEDDFEGIAVAEGRIWMVTSAGRLYEFEEGGDDESVLYAMVATGVGRRCEVEGLAWDPERRVLLLLCKRPLADAPPGVLAVHAWSVEERRLVAAAGLALSEPDLSRPLRGARFQASGIERHPVTGTWFVVAARQQAIAEVGAGGQVLAARRFPADWHRQIEGITFAPDGSLIVADEGAGGRARLTIYPPP